MPQAAHNFQTFIVRAIRTTPKTTEQLYTLATSRNLNLTKSRKRDTGRPSQFAWQHQLRRDQFTLQTQGVIYRTLDGEWAITNEYVADNFLTA